MTPYPYLRLHSLELCTAVLRCAVIGYAHMLQHSDVAGVVSMAVTRWATCTLQMLLVSGAASWQLAAGLCAAHAVNLSMYVPLEVLIESQCAATTTV